MNAPIALSDFERLRPTHEVRAEDGLSPAIDAVAARTPDTHHFLRYQWFAAAIEAYGGRARSWTVEADGTPVIALPTASIGPAALRMAMVAGCYWPFRGIPADPDAGPLAWDALLDTLGRELRVLRWGPVYDDDPALVALRAAAARRGWRAVPRFVAESFLLDMAGLRAEGTWPRNSTLRKNRFHEKHLGEHGALDWRFASGAGWDAATFDALAAVERGSWIAERTDGTDAKFASERHGRFWRLAAKDPAIAQAMHAALLTINGLPSAFSFDLDAGGLKYAIANSYLPAFAKHSPGKLLYYRNLVQALGRGIGRVDWGAGDSGYKRTIGAEEGPAIRDWLFVRPGIDAGLARLLGGVWRRTGNGIF